MVRNLGIDVSVHRDASWASSNFSSMSIIPIDHTHRNNQDELYTVVQGAGSRITVETTGSYTLGYDMNIDSTGGSTWNLTAEIFKNGVTMGEAYRTRTGNYGNEDQSISKSNKKIDLVAGDYIDLRIDQNNLTGNLLFASLDLSIRL